MRGPVITTDMVAEIRRLLGDGHSMRTVADMLGISRSSVKKYQTEDAIERRNVTIARTNQTYRERQRAERRNGSPPAHMAIRTASPIVRELFEEMWRQGLKQHEIARRIGVSHNVLTLWKKGRTGPSMFSAQAMADVLGYELVLQKRDV